MMASHALVDTFESAKREFLSRLPKRIPASFEEFTTINEVYKAAEEIQAEQASTRMRRNLGKIQPFLECLRHYGEVIETFVTVKSDILALIWGPIKFLLLASTWTPFGGACEDQANMTLNQTSITYNKSFDNLVNVMAQIGHSLPAFEKYTQLFQGNKPIQQVLCLFYQDILDLYSTFLEFFLHTGWKSFFDALWPKSAERIRVITENVKEHKLLMDDSITLAHVVEAHAARRRTFEEFERQHEFRQRQDFEAVKSSLNPVLYDRDLQRLKACRVPRSGDWLLNQEEHKSWIDPSDKTTRLLWLQGIPGAGKTFLSCSVVECIADRGDPIVFAFLDYQFRESISTLQLLHSFIWQIALDNDGLQAPLILAYKQHYRRLKSDLCFVKDLFSHLLDSIPTVFIVIDGLDEIPQAERLQLLRTILEILQAKNNVKILISSRPEDDISNLISKETKPIRVHDCNSHDIQAYVNSRASSLVSDARLAEPGLAQEISNQMKAIAGRSEGMFLYARLVCDSIDLLGDIDSIKEAVENLPEGLNEAYDRILSRITDGLQSRQRDDARQILALIACSVVPLSKNEIQLAVYTAHGRNPSKGCKGLFLNILDRCGPIIEEIDGQFRFVHFSAREYLLSAQSDHYLTEPAAHACIASMCIKYLSSACFDVDIDDDTLSSHVRSGAFVLFAYVCNHWLHHIEKVGKQEYQSLMNDINRLIDVRVNPSFTGEAIVSESHDASRLQNMNSVEEKIERMLGSAHSFSRIRNRDVSFDDDEDWNFMDPFTFTETEARFRHTLESMLCETIKHKPDCACQELKNIYGNSIYKCGRPGCPLYRVGFDTKSRRAEHIQRHIRPFKCEHSECAFAALGFAKETHLKSHLANAHNQNQHVVPRITQERTNASSEEELKAILIDAVQENDLSMIQAEAEAVRRFIHALLLSAYKGRSSDAIIKHLVGEIPQQVTYLGWQDHRLKLCLEIFTASIDHGNYDVFGQSCNLFYQWYQPTPNGIRNSVIKAVGRKRCPDLVEVLSSNLLAMGDSIETFKIWNFCSLLVEVIPREPDTQAEILALECFERIQPQLSEHSSYLLAQLAGRCCSIAIAEFFLANGAAVDGLYDERTGTQGPIYSAAKQTNREAAKFMEFLVKRGARTEIQIRMGKKLSEFPGPKNIQKWIGITWQELTKQKCRGHHQ